MAAILLGYFTTMVATLVALMMLLNTVLPFGLTDPVHHHPRPVIAQAQPLDNSHVLDNSHATDNKQAAVTDKQTGRSGAVVADKASTPSTVSVSPARLATARQSLPDRNRRLKSALNQNHKEDAIGRWQDQEHSLALGFAQETRRQPGPLFDMFAPRRF
jgi:hypothetical protein